MKLKKILKTLILSAVSCITILANFTSVSAYYELPYYHESGASNYYNVKIDNIYYDLSLLGHKENQYAVYAFYPVVNNSTLKIPDKIKFKGRKYKIENIWFDLYDKNELYELYSNWKGKVTLPYKTIYLPKYANSFYCTSSVKLNKLRKLYVPKNVCDLSGINDKPKLKVIIDKNNSYIKMKNGAVYSKDGKNMYFLVNSKKTYKIAKGTKFITLGSNKTVEKVILPSSITNLTYGAFGRCFKLKSIKLNNELKVIEYCAFEKCKSLKKITIPKNVEKIEFWAFKNCKKLSKVKLESEEKSPAIENTAFKNTKDGIKFVVKNQTVADQLKEQLKGSGVKNAKILVGKKVVYTNVK